MEMQITLYDDENTQKNIIVIYHINKAEPDVGYPFDNIEPTAACVWDKFEKRLVPITLTEHEWDVVYDTLEERGWD